MAYQTVFKRYELKYLLTAAQKRQILSAMEPYMRRDDYGRTTIRNLYFDTEGYRMIRRSLEHPIYKEKLRIRSYARATSDSTVFVELKKKYDHVVYKRRLALTEAEAMRWVAAGGEPPKKTQIAAEIDYLLHFYGDLRPTVFLSYEREAYYPTDGSSFRVTFDENILCRRQALSLTCEAGGDPILDPSLTLMELKCGGGMPLWMAGTLSALRVRKTSFSKYGSAYIQFILKENKKHEHIQGIV